MKNSSTKLCTFWSSVISHFFFKKKKKETACSNNRCQRFWGVGGGNLDHLLYKSVPHSQFLLQDESFASDQSHFCNEQVFLAFFSNKMLKAAVFGQQIVLLNFPIFSLYPEMLLPSSSSSFSPFCFFCNILYKNVL